MQIEGQIPRGVRVDGDGRLVVGNGCELGAGTRIHLRGGSVVIGDAAVVGERCAIVAHASVELARGCRLGDGVVIEDAVHTYEDSETPIRHQPLQIAAVRVGEGARVGHGACLRPGVTIGAGATVAPHVVVGTDVAAGATLEGTAPGAAARFEAERSMCAALSARLGEDMGGTAPAERGFLIVERCRAWGRDPAGELGELGERAAAAGLRVQTVRRTTQRYEAEHPRAWIAGVAPGARFLEAFDDVAELAGVELSADRPTGRGRLEHDPLFLCCTHGTRDACCARLGVPTHKAFCQLDEERTWHASHLGGHRFAATMAVLPHGVWYGRVPPDRAGEIIAAARAGRLVIDLLRGVAGRPAAAQVAELALRRELACDGIDDLPGLAVEQPEDHRWRVQLAGREIEVTWAPTGAPRAFSCGTGAKVEDPGRYSVVSTVPRPG